MHATTHAFLFDLDGTLLDTEILWVEATEQYLAEQGHAVSRAEVMAIVYGRSWTDVHADIVRRFPALDMPIEAMNEVMHPYFRRLRDTRDIRIPGSVELFRTLAARYPAGIVSGSTRRDVEHGIHMLGLDGLVEVYIGSEDTPRGKPAPDGFLLAARQLKTPAEACVVFEDSCAGVRAAKAAGMRCVALARPGRPVQDLSGADLVVETLAAFNLDRLPE